MQTNIVSVPGAFTPRQRKELFDEIVLLYDLADQVLAAVMQDGIVNRTVQADLATPFVRQVTNSADILSALFTEVACKDRPITPDVQQRLEGAFRDIFEALHQIVDGMEEKLLPQGDKE